MGRGMAVGMRMRMKVIVGKVIELRPAQVSIWWELLPTSVLISWVLIESG